MPMKKHWRRQKINNRIRDWQKNSEPLQKSWRHVPLHVSLRLNFRRRTPRQCWIGCLRKFMRILNFTKERNSWWKCRKALERTRRAAMEKWTEKRPFPPCIPKTTKRRTWKNLSVLVGHSKTAEKHWRTLSERRRHSPRQTKTRGKEGGGEKAPGSSLVLPRLQQWCLSSVSTAMPCACIG